MKINYNEDDNEGEINIPKVMKLSNKSFLYKKMKLDNYRKNNLSNISVNSFLSDTNYDNNDKLNNTVIIDKNKFFLKNEDNNSTTSKSSMNDKIKKVTFSTVEIIRVKNYKRYNKLNTAKKNENNNDSFDINCTIF